MSIEVVYANNVDRVYRFFYAKTFDRQTAEDLTSQTFLALLEKMQECLLTEQQILKPNEYLSGVMRHIWTGHLRHKYRIKEVLYESLEDFEVYVTNTADRFNNSHLKTIAGQYIDQLPDSQRTVLRMRLLEESTLGEIAEALKKNMNYVKTTQRRSLANLRKMLALERKET